MWLDLEFAPLGETSEANPEAVLRGMSGRRPACRLLAHVPDRAATASGMRCRCILLVLTGLVRIGRRKGLWQTLRLRPISRQSRSARLVQPRGT